MDWWKREVIYQIYPRSFCDSNNDGIGDINGIISKLSYLKDLGVGAIWISPLTCSPDFDNGYDVSDYYNIDPKFGTLEDYKKLIKEAKKLNIKIIMDLVINHTSHMHKWFIESKKIDSPYHNYYIWKEPKIIKGKKHPPNNWDSLFLGPAWTYCEENGLYYLHLFTKQQPDLNYRNPQVIEEVKKIMRFWLDIGVAGFRCDVINLIYKTSYADGKKKKSKTGIEFYLSQKGCHDILKKLNTEILKPYGAFTVGETIYASIEDAKLFTHDELSLVFPFEHTSIDTWFNLPVFRKKYNPQRMINVLKKWQQNTAWTPLFFENHDQPRSVSRFGDAKKYHKESVKALATILLTLKGTPFIYQGQEIGIPNTNFSDIEEINDVATKNVFNVFRKMHLSKKLAFKLAMNYGRDNSRTPMPWNDSDNGGFCRVKPWLRCTDTYQTINVKRNLEDIDSCFNYYKKLIALRNTEDALKIGSIEFINAGKNIFAYRRIVKERELLILCNMSGKSANLKIQTEGIPVLFNYKTFEMNKKTLRPYEAVILNKDPHSKGGFKSGEKEA